MAVIPVKVPFAGFLLDLESFARFAKCARFARFTRFAKCARFAGCAGIKTIGIILAQQAYEL